MRGATSVGRDGVGDLAPLSFANRIPNFQWLIVTRPCGRGPAPQGVHCAGQRDGEDRAMGSTSGRADRDRRSPPRDGRSLPGLGDRRAYRVPCVPTVRSSPSPSVVVMELGPSAPGA